MNPRLGLRGTGLVLATLASAWSCGGSSTSEPGGPGSSSSSTTASGSGSSTGSGAGGATGSTTTNGSTTSTTTDGSTTTNGSTTSGGGAGGGATTSGGGAGGGATTSGGGMGGAGMGGSGMGGAGGAGMGCPVLANFTLSVHVVIDVTWDAMGFATTAGSGKVHIWNRTKLATNGSKISGDDTQACGTVLPEFGLTQAAAILVGGNKVLIEIPNEVWDKPTMPKFHSEGTLSAWAIGGTADFMPTYGLVGVNFGNMPTTPWPAKYTGFTMGQVVDSDGDGKPGITAVPHNGNGYVQPPVSTFGPKADKLYLATRTVIALKGKLTACEALSGTAEVPMFDNHVVGCHRVSGGDANGDCVAADIGFVDDGRTLYKTGAATWTAKRVPDNATCADVRAALP